MMWFMIAVLFWIVFGAITAVVAAAQYRNYAAWFWVGFLLGPIGLLLAVLMPAKKPLRPVPSGELSDYNDMPLVWDENRIDQAEVDRILDA
jgi:hypothetical protein